MSGHDTMSLEAAMDEERRAILEILERQAGNKKPPPPARRSDSPTTAPRSPIRSMLDVGGDTSPARKSSSPPPPVRYRSMLDVDFGRPRSQQVRSMLDSDAPASSAPGPAHSTHSSISETASQNAPGGSPRSTMELPRAASPQRNPLSEYQFGDIITSQLGQSLPMPKRNQQGGRNTATSPLVKSHPLPSGASVPDPPRHSISGPIVRKGNQSTSPHGRRSLRALSPQPGYQPGNQSGKGKVLTLDSGHEFDLGKAYKNLSNANLMSSEGPLAALAAQKVEGQAEGEGRLEKSYLGPDGSLYTSSEDEEDDDDDDHRGRSAAPRIIHSSASDPDLRPPSLLSAAEDERKYISLKFTRGQRVTIGYVSR